MLAERAAASAAAAVAAGAALGEGRGLSVGSSPKSSQPRKSAPSSSAGEGADPLPIALAASAFYCQARGSRRGRGAAPGAISAAGAAGFAERGLLWRGGKFRCQRFAHFSASFFFQAWHGSRLGEGPLSSAPSEAFPTYCHLILSPAATLRQ